MNAAPQVDDFDLISEQAAAIALTTSALVDRTTLERHLREVDERLIWARGVEAKRALVRDYSFTNSLLIYLRDVAGFVR